MGSREIRAAHLLRVSEQLAAAKLDHLFAGIFLGQWLLALAYVLTHGSNPDDIVIGAAIATVPTALIVWKPGAAGTRHAIAITQMLYGTLLVHLTAGRLGSPFHGFVSLTCLALYRDWRVMLTATAVALVLVPTRGAEHLGWLALAAVALGLACRRGHDDMVVLARRKAALEEQIANQEPVTIVAVDATTPLATAPTLPPTAIVPACIFSDLEMEEGMDELLEGFVQRLNETAIELEVPMTQEDLRCIAHRLCGTAGSYGFPSISAVAREVEVDPVASKVGELADLCRKARARRLFARAA